MGAQKAHKPVSGICPHASPTSPNPCNMPEAATTLARKTLVLPVVLHVVLEEDETKPDFLRISGMPHKLKMAICFGARL